MRHIRKINSKLKSACAFTIRIPLPEYTITSNIYRSSCSLVCLRTIVEQMPTMRLHPFKWLRMHITLRISMEIIANQWKILCTKIANKCDVQSGDAAANSIPIHIIHCHPLAFPFSLAHSLSISFVRAHAPDTRLLHHGKNSWIPSCFLSPIVYILHTLSSLFLSMLDCSMQILCVFLLHFFFFFNFTHW